MELWIGGHLRSFRRCTVPNALEGYGRSAETYQPDCPRASALQTCPRFVGNVTPKSPNRCKQHAELMERIKMSKKIVSARRPSQHARFVRYPFGASDATICSKRGSPRNGSQNGNSFR